METVDTVVIGAGPAGLAVGACLQQRGIPHAIFERADSVGSSWRGHYDRLHLHTVKEHSGLPHRPFPSHVPRYPSRLQVISYLEDYARHFEIEPRFGHDVTAVEYQAGRWHTTANGTRIRSRHVVVATGYNDTAVVPAWPDQDDFAGEILHARAYRNGEPLAGKKVLVVGAGNTGAEIALDALEHGAQVWLAVRSPIWIIRRDPLGVPAQLQALALDRLPTLVADAVARRLVRATVGDLSRWGIREPAQGPVSMVIEHGRIPLIDVGTLEAIRGGDINVVPGLERFDEAGVVFTDGRRLPFDSVILATGYRADVRRVLSGAGRVTDARGLPTCCGREAEIPGLFFVGFRNPLTGMLREIAIEAERVARQIGSAR